MSKQITLLDGNVYDKDELLAKMENDDYYYGELSKLALSSSALKLLLESPKTYYYVTKYGQNETTPALRSGHLFHLAILEPEKYDKIKFVEVQSRNAKAFKEAHAEYGEVYTAKERDENNRLIDAFFKNPKAIELISNSKREVPAIGNVLDTNMPFRGKADVLKNKGGIVDIKTTQDVQNFDKSAFKYKYHLQAAIYIDLFSTPEKPLTHEDFTFLCISKNTLDIGVWKCSEAFVEYGRKELRRGVELYKTYIREDFDINDYTIQGTL
ncbi:MAG: hypothetical protein EBY39_03200 [Flavobacteriia bacterium]|nr:hypothetical protein [Flavobacteriia bacterium]